MECSSSSDLPMKCPQEHDYEMYWRDIEDLDGLKDVLRNLCAHTNGDCEQPQQQQEEQEQEEIMDDDFDEDAFKGFRPYKSAVFSPSYSFPTAAAAAAAASPSSSSSLISSSASSLDTSEASSFAGKLMFKRTMELHQETHKQIVRQPAVAAAHLVLEAAAAAHPVLEAAAAAHPVLEAAAAAPKLEEGEAVVDLNSAGFSHKLAERKRRKAEAGFLNKLRARLPNLKKKDKVSTLAACIDYIEELEGMLSSVKKKQNLETSSSAVQQSSQEMMSEQEMSLSTSGAGELASEGVSNSTTSASRARVRLLTGGRQDDFLPLLHSATSKLCLALEGFHYVEGLEYIICDVVHKQGKVVCAAELQQALRQELMIIQ